MAGVLRGVKLAGLCILLVLSASCGAGREKPAPEQSASQPVPNSVPAAFSARPNLIILLVDTLRADALGFAGYQNPVSPRLDQWARQGVIFEQATTPAGWTKPAVVSLFSALYPATHGVQDKDHVTPDQVLMLAEVLKDQGYETAAFVTNFAVSEQFGLAQGFDLFRFFDPKKESPPDAPKNLNYLQAQHVMPEVEAYVERMHPRPYFLYVHLTDPHFPYKPPAEHRLFGKTPRGLYDGEVRNVDGQLGEIMDLLSRTGQLEQSVVVLTSDHGEEFREHGGTGHGVTIFEECTRVPLVVWAKGAVPGRRKGQVSLSDVAPTLLEGAKISAPPAFGRQGRSFWKMVLGQQAPGGWSWAYNELVFPSKGITFAYREGDEKVLYIEKDYWGRKEQIYLFDLARDPHEQRSLAASRPQRVQELRAAMRSIRRQHLTEAVASQTEALDEDAIRRLRALGYID